MDENHAIQDALTKRDIEDLCREIKRLREYTHDGFQGVHKRQDMTNGKVQQNTQHRMYITAAVGILSFIITVFFAPLMFIILRYIIDTSNK